MFACVCYIVFLSVNVVCVCVRAHMCVCVCACVCVIMYMANWRMRYVLGVFVCCAVVACGTCRLLAQFIYLSMNHSVLSHSLTFCGYACDSV